MTTDILVIGSGISGLTYAIKIAELHPELQLILIAKDELRKQIPATPKGGLLLFLISNKIHLKNTFKTP